MTDDLSQIGGNCPVQGFGRIDDHPGLAWYFRARGDGWSLDVGPPDGTDYVDKADAVFSLAGRWNPWPSAGWMLIEEAETLIRAGLAAFRAAEACRRARMGQDVSDDAAAPCDAKEGQETGAKDGGRV
jgi:hypothetical protein